jgi:hypothetical protein
MPRASWRGYLRLSLVSCPIYLTLATARTKPIRLHQVWRGAPGEDGGDLEDQVGGQDVSERPASSSTTGCPWSSSPTRGRCGWANSRLTFPGSSPCWHRTLPMR